MDDSTTCMYTKCMWYMLVTFAMRRMYDKDVIIPHFMSSMYMCLLYMLYYQYVIVSRLLSLNTQGMDPLLLHDLIEKVVLLRHAIHRKTRRDPTPLTNTVLGNRIRFVVYLCI